VTRTTNRKEHAMKIKTIVIEGIEKTSDQPHRARRGA
jgi:hypothetical protein